MTIFTASLVLIPLPVWLLRKLFEVSAHLNFYTVNSTLRTICSINLVRLGVILIYAQTIIEASPIGYVKDAKLRGIIFTPEDISGRVSCVDTGFFVDHTEPLEALARVREESD